MKSAKSTEKPKSLVNKEEQVLDYRGSPIVYLKSNVFDL